MEKISDRISKIIDNETISTRSFELKIGASNGVISKCVLKGTDINSIWLSKIIETFPKYNPGWLLTGKGDMVLSLFASEPSVIYKTEKCLLCQEKDRTIQVLESLNELLKERLKDLQKSA